MAKLRALEGLWTAELMMDGQPVNIGVLVFRPRRTFGDFFEEGSVLGGNRHYVYVGHYHIENFIVSSRIRVQRYDVHQIRPLFGDDDDFELSLAGQLDKDIERDVISVRASNPSRSETELRLTRRVSS